MAKCVVCNNFYPPSFTKPTEDNLANKCRFCIAQKNELEYIDPETKQKYIYTKKEIVNEYKKFIKDLFQDNDKIRRMILGGNDENK